MIGERLKELRNKKELTQNDVAKLLGVSQAAYQRYENEERSVPDDIKKTLAKYYNVSIDYLLGVTNSSIPQSSKDIPYSEDWLLNQYDDEGQKMLSDYLKLLESRKKKKNNK